MTVVTKYKYLAWSRRLMVWLRTASVAVHFQGGISAPQCCVHFVPVDEACAEIEVLKFNVECRKRNTSIKVISGLETLHLLIKFL